MRSLTWERVASLFAKALQAGAERKGVSRVVWDIATRCHHPKTVILSAAPSEGLSDTRTSRRSRFVVLVPGLTRCTLTVELHTRCRACPPCLRMRAAKWRFAARSETRIAMRTWFGTLTFTPTEQFVILTKARRAAGRKGEDFDALRPLERFRYLANASGALVTKWLKRVRKESGASLRYLLVAEAHKSGAPHYHVLIHEVHGQNYVRKAVLKRQWSHGFSKWNLVNDLRTADYVCKYLSKSLMARVRASVRYGKPRPVAIEAKLRVDLDPKKQLHIVGSFGD